MSLFADTNIWSHTFRRDIPQSEPQVRALIGAFSGREAIFTTGLVLQELLQGFAGPKAHIQIVERFSALTLLTPETQDHVEAAELRNRCRRAGVQVDTIDILLAQLCIRYDLIMLTLDQDFTHIAKHSPLKLWKP